MIVGLDLSLSSTGIAHGDGTLATISPRTGPDDRGRRLVELRDLIIGAIRRRPPLPALAVIEDYADHAPGILALERMAELRGTIEARLFELDVPIVHVRPAMLKRFATGNGRADKTEMTAAAKALGYDPANDDEADAAHLRHLAQVAHGLADPSTARVHRGIQWDVIAALTWPNLSGLSLDARKAE